MEKIFFRVESPPSFLPAESESLNASLVSDESAVLKNSPIFTPKVAYGDLIGFSMDAVGLRWFSKVIQKSAYSSIRVVCGSGDFQRMVAVLDDIVSLGAGYSGQQEHRYAVVTIPPEVSYLQVLKLLNQLPRGQYQIRQMARRHSMAS